MLTVIGQAMTDLLLWFDGLAIRVEATGSWAVLVIGGLVIAQRAGRAVHEQWERRLARRYQPLLQRALRGDHVAVAELSESPRRHRIPLAWLLVTPLIDDRDPVRISRSRAIFEALALMPVADRFLRSQRWWRRALGLRAMGLLQDRAHAAAIVAALDDPHGEVRAAALDAIADLGDPGCLPALIVRVHDESLHRGRRLAAVAAFGAAAEELVLEVAPVDVANRLNYARVLAVCGTARSRPTLCDWTRDARAAVQAVTFEALARVGHDATSARLAIDALENGDDNVRAMAAFSLQGWTGPGGAAVHLERHLEDAWPVAMRAARTLRTMREPGLAALRTGAARPGLAGLLARQTLWELSAWP